MLCRKCMQMGRGSLSLIGAPALAVKGHDYLLGLHACDLTKPRVTSALSLACSSSCTDVSE